MIVAAACPECEASVDVDVLFIRHRYDFRRGLKPDSLIAVVPVTCSTGHPLDTTACERLRKNAIAQRECVACGDPITMEQESFPIDTGFGKGGRCHESPSCRSFMIGMDADDYFGDPLPQPHVADWPADQYKPWMR